MALDRNFIHTLVFYNFLKNNQDKILWKFSKKIEIISEFLWLSDHQYKILNIFLLIGSF